MTRKKQIIFPAENKLLAAFGERLKIARLRRNISAEAIAARSNISRMTLYRAEQGEASVSMGTYFRILAALHLQDDINALAADDKLGRTLQDAKLKKSSP